MKRSGRASLFVIVALLVVGALGFLMFQAGDSPTGVAGRFMTALAKQDKDTLVQLSYMDGMTKEQIDDAWEETLAYGKHYRFVFGVKQAVRADEDQAGVRVDVARNAYAPSSYEEKFELPLIRLNGKWLVDVRGINREMYPGLPR